MNRKATGHNIASRLLRHHLPVAAGSALACVTIAALINSDHTPYRWSMATAYVALTLMAATLLAGPLSLLRQRPNLPSTDIRRDLGIWACLLGLAHTVIGLQVHMKSMWLYFFNDVSGPQAWSVRSDRFGAANYTGLAGVLMLLFLAALSNDFSLRRLGIQRWKSLQRWNYVLFAVVIAHAVLFQLIEKRSLPWPVLLGALIIPTLTAQAVGVGLTRRKRSLANPDSAAQ